MNQLRGHLKRIKKVFLAFLAVVALSLLFNNCAGSFETIQTDFEQASMATPADANDCAFNSRSVPDGGSVTAYMTSAPASGASCVAEVRTCTRGVLSGTYLFSHCARGPAACLFGANTTIPSGGSVVAYSSATVPAGQNCVSQTRTCTDGILSGSYTSSSCRVSSAAACRIGSLDILSGNTTTAYQTNSVPYGQACKSETVTCTNGTLSGSFRSPTCSVQAPPIDSCGRTPERRQKIISLMTSVIPALKASAGNDANYPQIIYDIQEITAAPLQAAINCKDEQMLESLVGLYAIPFAHLKVGPSGDRMWLDKTNHEIVLDSTQFIFAAAKMVNAIVNVPPQNRTSAMLNFMASPSSPRVDVIGHLGRWLHYRSMWTWSDCGVTQSDPLLEYTFPDYVNRKLHRTLGYASGAPVYCNALMEPEMWIATAAVELLAADATSHDAIGLDPTLAQELRTYAQLATKLFESRVSFAQACSDGTCVGALVDVGGWHGHPEFPSNLWPNGGEIWDFSHFRRYAQWIDTLYTKRQISGGVFDLDGITKAFGNELAYKVFNGNYQHPTFANYWNGRDITYPRSHITYAPSELSSSYYRSGYGFWGRHQSDVDKINRALLSLIEAKASSAYMLSAGVPPGGDYDLLGFYCSLAYAP